MSHVFVSYSRSTPAPAQRVVEALRSIGYDVWWDDELPVHRTFSPYLQERLDAAKAIVVIWTKDAIDSDYVRAEAEAGRSARKLVQVSADGTPPPLPFNQTQYVNFGLSDTFDAPAWRKVVASIAELTSGAAVRPSTPKDARIAPPAQARSLLIGFVGGSILLTAVIATVWWTATRDAEPTANS